MPIISDNTWFCLARKWSSHTAWVCPVPPAQQTLDNIPYVAVTFGIVRMLSKRITWLKSILKYWNSIRLLFAPTKSINLPTMRSCAWPGRDVIDANILETATSAVSISFSRWVVSARFLFSARIGRIGETNGRKGGLVNIFETWDEWMNENHFFPNVQKSWSWKLSWTPIWIHLMFVWPSGSGSAHRRP